MENIKVTYTRTGNQFHASRDGMKTVCGRKVKGTYGPLGTLIEMQVEKADGTYGQSRFVPASVTCHKCN